MAFTVEQLTSGKLTRYFKLSEFACKGKSCCGESVCIDDGLIGVMSLFREYVGKPFIISSGFRCKKHNAAVGGALNSLHTFGYAADIIVPEGKTVDEFADIAQAFDFGCVIRYPQRGFIHVDVRNVGKQLRLVK